MLAGASSTKLLRRAPRRGRIVEGGPRRDFPEQAWKARATTSTCRVAKCSGPQDIDCLTVLATRQGSKYSMLKKNRRTRSAARIRSLQFPGLVLSCDPQRVPDVELTVDFAGGPPGW